MSPEIHYGLASGLVLLLSLGLSRMMIRINIVDVPNHRSTHQVPTPTAGGVGIVVSYCAILAILCFVDRSPCGGNVPLAIVALLGGLIGMFGLVDDLRPLTALQKFVGQSVVVALFCAGVSHVDRLWLPGLGLVDFGFFGYVITYLWMVGFTNAFNCLDGLDGLAGMGALVGSAFLAAIAHFSGADLIAGVAMMLFAATLGFFVFNFPRGRIFMGDAGSQFLGFMFAALAVLGANNEGARISFYIVPMVFYLFIFDFAATLWIRGVRRQRILDGHREYLFHICHRLGLGQSQVCVLYSIFFIQNGIAASFAQSAQPWLAVNLVLAMLPLHLAFGYLVYTLGQTHGLYVTTRLPRSDGGDAVKSAD